jgi:hypothetical protein
MAETLPHRVVIPVPRSSDKSRDRWMDIISVIAGAKLGWAGSLVVAFVGVAATVGSLTILIFELVAHR